MNKRAVKLVYGEARNVLRRGIKLTIYLVDRICLILILSQLILVVRTVVRFARTPGD